LFFGNSSSYCSGIVDTLRILFDFVGDLFCLFPKNISATKLPQHQNSEFGSEVLGGVIGFLRKKQKSPLVLYIFSEQVSVIAGYYVVQLKVYTPYI